MPGHFHAVVWIDHKQARIFHFNVDEADRTVIRDHIVRDLHSRLKRTRPPDRRGQQAVLRGCRQGDRRRRRDLIVGPAQEKDSFAKFLAEKHPAIRAHVEGVETPTIRPTANSSTHARRYRQSRRPHAAATPSPASTDSGHARTATHPLPKRGEGELR